MDNDKAYLRKTKRIIFEEKVEIRIIIPGPPARKVSASIINLSEGGTAFTAKVDDVTDIHSGDHLTLTEINITGKTALRLVVKIEIEIRWTNIYPVFKQMIMGCKFLNLTDEIKAQLRQVVDLGVKAG